MNSPRVLVATDISPATVLFFHASALLIREWPRDRLVAAGIDQATAGHLGAIAGFLFFSLLICPVIWPRRASVARLFAFPGRLTVSLLAAVGAGILLRAADWAGRIAMTQLMLPGDPANASGPLFWWQCPPPAQLWLGVVVLGLGTPFFEELVFRGFVFGSLLRRGRGLATLLSAAAFALLHPPTAMAAAFVYGLVAARQFLRFGTLWIPIATHATFNLMITIDWHCLDVHWVPATTSFSSGIAALLACLALVAIAFRLSAIGAPER